jgi:hypothetical protein
MVSRPSRLCSETMSTLSRGFSLTAGQRFGNPTIEKQRKSKQFKSARVVKTLPRTDVLPRRS